MPLSLPSHSRELARVQEFRFTSRLGFLLMTSESTLITGALAHVCDSRGKR
jgi:hypothetical protein